MIRPSIFALFLMVSSPIVAAEPGAVPPAEGTEVAEAVTSGEGPAYVDQEEMDRAVQEMEEDPLKGVMPAVPRDESVEDMDGPSRGPASIAPGNYGSTEDDDEQPGSGSGARRAGTPGRPATATVRAEIRLAMEPVKSFSDMDRIRDAIERRLPRGSAVYRRKVSRGAVEFSVRTPVGVPELKALVEGTTIDGMKLIVIGEAESALVTRVESAGGGGQ